VVTAGYEIAERAEAEWAAVHPNGTVHRLHPGTDPLPAQAWVQAGVGAATPEAGRAPAQNEAFVLVVTNPAMEALRDLAEQEHTRALDAAPDTGRALAGA
jgi:hypothetical protein